MTSINVLSAFIRDEDKVLLLRRSKDSSILPGYWELPGGKHLVGDQKDCLAKIVLSETSLKVQPTRLYTGFNYTNEQTGVHYYGTCFHALNNPDEEVLLDLEHDQYAWVDKSDLGEYQIQEDLLKAIQDGFKYTRKERMPRTVKYPRSTIW